ncbi:MAG: DUF2490 domain-containing protein [Flavobacteriales bacterium]
MKKALIIIFSIICSSSLYGQQIEVLRDFGIWTGIDLEKKLSPNLNINLEQQVRFYSDVSELDDYIIDLGGKYRLNSNFKLGLNLRYTYNARRNKTPENNNRYNLDLHYKAKLTKKIQLNYRLRYQQQFTDLFSREKEASGIRSAVRNKLRIRFKLNDTHKLHTSAELFRRMETFREPYFNQLRFYLGDVINTKIGDFDIAFGYEQEINTTFPQSFFFIKTGYTIKF